MLKKLAVTPTNMHEDVPTLTAKKSLLVKSLLENKNKLLDAVKVLPAGPAHVILPQQITHNMRNLRSAFETHGIKPRILLSHKPSKSNALIKQACAENTGLDVSSKNELISGLKNGFNGNDICCTGSKNDEYITLSIQHNCLHSMDSINELNRYISLHKKIDPHKKVNILLRINSADAPYIGAASRFGIYLRDVKKCYEILKQNNNVCLEGFHMHSGEEVNNLRAEEFGLLLELIQQAYSQGFTPKTIDVGGSFPINHYDNQQECNDFIQQLILAMKDNRQSFTWRKYTYGLEVAPNLSILGQQKLNSQFTSEKLGDFVSKILNESGDDERKYSEIIKECGFSLALEPGMASYNQCGIMLFKVVDTFLNAEGECITMLDGNISNLSLNMMEQMADPLLLTQNENDNASIHSSYLVGNLCTEADIMIKRKVVLQNTPKTGDYLCFVNTAGYVSDFYDAPTHQHPMGQKIVALQKENSWHFMSEDNFNPYLSYES